MATVVLSRKRRVNLVDIQAHVFIFRLHVLVSVFGCFGCCSLLSHTHADRLLLQEQPAFPGTSTFCFSSCFRHAAIMSRQKKHAMKQVSYPRKKIVEVLRTLEEIVVSLDRIGSGAHDQTKEEHDATVAAFIQKHAIFKKAAKARRILSDAFSRELGPDDMEELEREMQGVRYWTSRKKK